MPELLPPKPENPASARQCRRRRSSAALPALALAALGACSIPRSAGEQFAAGAVDRLRSDDSAVVALQRELADSARVYVQEAFERAVVAPAEDAFAGIRRDARTEVDSLGERFKAVLREGLDETLPAGIDRNADLLQPRMDGLGETFGRSLATGLTRGVAEELRPAADSLVAGMIEVAALGVQTELQPAIHAMMMSLRDSLEARIRDMDRAVAESRTFSGLRYVMFGAITALLLAALGFALSQLRRGRRALYAMIDAIENAGHEGTKRAVLQRTRDAGVAGWLEDRIRKRVRVNPRDAAPPPDPAGNRPPR